MNIQDQIQIIKTKMPETYKAIQDREKGVTDVIDGKRVTVIPVYGAEVYALVRRGLRGEPNCFWAMEAGYVMGTPFNMPTVSRDIAWYMVSFGCLHVCTFPLLPSEVTNGTH
ncbi:hypothetical protein [Rhodoferax sp. TS-BS-61-7]|uniref:hypothetical protein n=1 Tax=Rhodoferax sp. TS-BS-61-7 TaxID=2094194 RepID=UPI000CF5EF38|nr:hypothetical protein [Rhodoferax sp. TS-BS-61-7]PQA78702.1 hypothetical protein C5F53_01615 [Rhodoferax sp. TS-BS-61-7]